MNPGMIRILDKTKVNNMLRSVFATLVGAIVVICSGCGGGGGDGSAAQPAAQAQKQVLIEADGDSTTVGYTVTNGVSGINPQNQVAVLQQLLRGRFGSTVTVSNQGVGNMEASQFLNGTDGRHPAWATQMAQSKANIVTIEFGLNEPYYVVNPTPGVESETPERFAQILTDMVSTARAAGKQVVLIEPNPSCEASRQPTEAYYVMQIDAVAKQMSVPLVSHYWTTLATPNWQSLLSDCVHPTTELYAIEAQETFKVLEPIVSSMVN